MSGILGYQVGSFQVAFAEAEKEVAIESPGNVPGSENPQISSCVVKALHANTGVVYIGAKGLTKASGFELSAGEGVSVDILGLGNLYGMSTKAGDHVCVLWVGP